MTTGLPSDGSWSGGAVNGGFWEGRRVLVTGHTGFKGAWLSLWLLQRGARVYGAALEPAPDALFSRISLQTDMDHAICDVRDYDAIGQRVKTIQPEFIFHLA